MAMSRLDALNFMKAAQRGDMAKQRVLAAFLIDVISVAENTATIPCFRSTASLIQLLFGNEDRETLRNAWNEHSNAIIACLRWFTKPRTLDERRALAVSDLPDDVYCACHGQGRDPAFIYQLHEPSAELERMNRIWSGDVTPIECIFVTMAYSMNVLLDCGYIVRYASDGFLSQTEAIRNTIILPYDAPTTVTSLCSWLAVSNNSNASCLVIYFIDKLERLSGCVSTFPALIPRVLVPLGLAFLLEGINDDLEEEEEEKDCDAENTQDAIEDCATLHTVRSLLQMDTRYIRAALGAQADILLPALNRFAYLCELIAEEAATNPSIGPEITEVYQRLAQRLRTSNILAESATEGHPFYAFSFFTYGLTRERCANPSCTRTTYTLERGDEEFDFKECAGCGVVCFCTAACKAAAEVHHAICDKLQASNIRVLLDMGGFSRMQLAAALCRQNVADVGLFAEIVDYLEATYIKTPYIPTDIPNIEDCD